MAENQQNPFQDQSLRPPFADIRATDPPHDVDTHRTFPGIAGPDAWQAHRRFIRERILISCGLYPLPAKTPLRAKVFGRIVRDGYSIENVHFQTYPGVYLAGNLYRPLSTDSKGQPHPAVLVAHGHWKNGRFANEEDGSIAARAITFARQGYVAFTYDMVGYNDTRGLDHRWANTLRHWLWGVSAMGLQTWNSVRALDFLMSLPDVDPARVAMTGESGGGTQTMILGAIDDRLAAVAPCVMVSHTMQGGCLCENAPGLRVDISNMEIAAAAAPKWQMIVGATGDWTATTQTVEGPAVAGIYTLLGIPDRIEYATFDYGHNINRTSREAVYDFFGRKWLGITAPATFEEPPYTMEPVESLQVFPEGTPLPADTKNAEQLLESLIQTGKEAIVKRLPRNARGLTLFKKTFLPMWRQTLAVEWPVESGIRATVPRDRQPGAIVHGYIGREGKGDSIPVTLLSPEKPGNGNDIVLIAHPQGRAAVLPGGRPGPLASALLAQGRTVAAFDAFLTGERADAAALAARQVPFNKYFSTYNRTNLQERIQDILTVASFLQAGKGAYVTVVGLEQAGLWSLLAAPAANAVVADCAQFDATTDDALLTDDLFVPGLRRLGDFSTAAILAAPHPLLLINTGDHFPAAATIEGTYRDLLATDYFDRRTESLSTDALVEWITEHTHVVLK